MHCYINYCCLTNKEGILHSQILFVSDFIIPKYTPINLLIRKARKQSVEIYVGNARPSSMEVVMVAEIFSLKSRDYLFLIINW
ncbi:MAG: hypothetical protein ACTSQP_18310 [Promethearchaeota archaeon]